MPVNLLVVTSDSHVFGHNYQTVIGKLWQLMLA